MKPSCCFLLCLQEGEGEKADTRQKVEEDRKPQIEAAIVRLMKVGRGRGTGAGRREVEHAGQLARRDWRSLVRVYDKPGENTTCGTPLRGASTVRTL